MPVSERRVCRVLGQHRTTQRKPPRGADGETALTQDIIALARQYGRYGYRRVTALLRDAGWHVNRKRVERIWRREGLKVPQKQPNAGGSGSMTDRASGSSRSIPAMSGRTTSPKGARMKVASSVSCRSSTKPAGSAWPCRWRGVCAARMFWPLWLSCSLRAGRRHISGPTMEANLSLQPCSSGSAGSA